VLKRYPSLEPSSFLSQFLTVFIYYYRYRYFLVVVWNPWCGCFKTKQGWFRVSCAWTRGSLPVKGNSEETERWVII